MSTFISDEGHAREIVREHIGADTKFALFDFPEGWVVVACPTPRPGKGLWESGNNAGCYILVKDSGEMLPAPTMKTPLIIEWYQTSVLG